MNLLDVFHFTEHYIAVGLFTFPICSFICWRVEKSIRRLMAHLDASSDDIESIVVVFHLAYLIIFLIVTALLSLLIFYL